MKNKTFYKEKAQSIKETILSIQNKGDNSGWDVLYDAYPGIEDAIREFIHVVYSFDHNLPLNKDLEKLKELQFRSKAWGNAGVTLKNFDTTISCIDFFLHYLETYVD